MRLLQLWRTSYGRRDGWDIELHGEVVGTLTDPEWVEMFWVSYRVTGLNEDGKVALVEPENWDGKFQYRSRSMGEYAEYAFASPGRRTYPDGSRVSMRALYLLPRNWWERVIDNAVSLFRR